MSNNEPEEITTDGEIDGAVHCLYETLRLAPTDFVESQDEMPKREVHDTVSLSDINNMIIWIENTYLLLRYVHPDYELSEAELEKVTDYLEAYDDARRD